MIHALNIPDGIGGEAVDLAKRVAQYSPGNRHSHRTWAAARTAILGENYDPLISERLALQFFDRGMRDRLNRHVTAVFNPGADITRALACVYKNGARRTTGSPTGDKALAKINEETFFGILAARLNQYGWFVGPTLEVPCVRNGRLCRDIITPDRYDVILDPDDPLGPPIAAGWMWPTAAGMVIRVVDQTHWRDFDPRTNELIAEQPHGITDPKGNPLFPGTIWRFDVPTDPADYFSRRRHTRLVDATVEVGAIATIMNWVRKTQNRKLISFFGDLERVSHNNKLDPEVPFVSHYEGEDAPPIISVDDMDIPVANFAEHIMLIYRNQIESFGIPQSQLTFDHNQDGTGVGILEIQHERLSQLRNEQVPFARHAELSSQYRVAETARVNKHPLAKGLPSKKQMWEGIEIEFPELNRIEDPSNLKIFTEFELNRGQTNDALLYQRRHPELTEEECAERVRDNLEKQAEFNEMKASRNLDPSAPMEDDNQRTGRVGGQAPSPDRILTPQEQAENIRT